MNVCVYEYILKMAQTQHQQLTQIAIRREPAGHVDPFRFRRPLEKHPRHLLSTCIIAISMKRNPSCTCNELYLCKWHHSLHAHHENARKTIRNTFKTSSSLPACDPSSLACIHIFLYNNRIQKAFFFSLSASHLSSFFLRISQARRGLQFCTQGMAHVCVS